jgi:hypothetical protein
MALTEPMFNFILGAWATVSTTAIVGCMQCAHTVVDAGFYIVMTLALSTWGCTGSEVSCLVVCLSTAAAQFAVIIGSRVSYNQRTPYDAVPGCFAKTCYKSLRYACNSHYTSRVVATCISMACQPCAMTCHHARPVTSCADVMQGAVLLVKPTRTCSLTLLKDMGCKTSVVSKAAAWKQNVESS